MKPEQINVIIAEHCGWVLSFDGEFWSWNHPAISHRVKHTAHKWMASQGVLPNYSGDLNAMHEAENSLTEKQWPEYREFLRNTVLGTVRMVSEWCKADIHATSAQRAEAFLHTIGKWKGGEV